MATATTTTPTERAKVLADQAMRLDFILEDFQSLHALAMRRSESLPEAIGIAWQATADAAATIAAERARLAS